MAKLSFGSFLPVIGDVIDGIFNTFAADKQQDYSSQNMHQQFEYNKQLQNIGFENQKVLNNQARDNEYQNWLNSFNAQNEYNSPVNQLNRLYDAGINPLWNGDGGTSSGSLASAPTSGSGSASSVGLGGTPDLMGMFSHFMQSSMQSLALGIEQQNADTQTSRAQHQNKVDDANAKKITVDTQIAEDMAPEQKRLVIAQTNLAIKQGNLTDSQKAVAETNVRFVKQQIKQSVLDCKMKLREFALNQTKFAWQKTKEKIELDQRNYSLATDRMNADSNYINADAARYNAYTSRLNYQLSEKRLSHDIFMDDKNYQLNVKRFEKEFSEMKADAIAKMLKDNQISPFGINLGYNKNTLETQFQMLDALTNVIDDADLPRAVDIIDNAQDGIDTAIQIGMSYGLMKYLGKGMGKYLGKQVTKGKPQTIFDNMDNVTKEVEEYINQLPK